MLPQHVGDYLSQNVEPENKEERVLQRIWNAASEEEQRAIASTMIKLSTKTIRYGELKKKLKSS